MWGLFDNEAKTISIVIEKDKEACEIKNLVILPTNQGKGYGKKMIQYLCSYYQPFYKLWK